MMQINIVAKSDQLNAVDLDRPTVFVITDVTLGTEEQPYDVRLAGWPQPWRPSKTGLRQLIRGWGRESDDWIGRAVELYRDDTVTWAGAAVGGIRVSRMSHLLEEVISMNLPLTRGKTKLWKVGVIPEVEALRAEWQHATPERRLEIEATQKGDQP